MQLGIFKARLRLLLEINYEDNSIYPYDATLGCRISAAKTNYGLRTGQRAQNVRRSPRKWRSCCAAPRLVHDNYKQLDRVDLSKRVDLKLVSRLEFGSGAVAMRYEPRR